MAKPTFLNHLRNLKLQDLPDQHLFFGCFAVGTFLILVMKAFNIPQVIVEMAPAAVMGAYVGITWSTERFRAREDKVGDNCYYLGFLFTLVSLAYALWAFSSDGADGAGVIITNFGIAISTTICGLALRVFFNQMREDPLEYEYEARRSLAEATRELRAELASICTEMSNFKRKTLQIMEEGVDDITESSRKTLTENVERFSATNTEVIEHIRTAFESFTEHSTRINKTAAKNAEALEALFERIEKIEASPDLLSDKLNPIIEKFAEVSEQTITQSRTQAQDLANIQKAIDGTLAATEALRTATEMVSTHFESKIERFNEGVAGSVAVTEQFRDALGAAASGLRDEMDAGMQAAAALKSGVEAHRKAIEEIKSAIESDMATAARHKEVAAGMLRESQEAVGAVEKSLVSLSRSLVEQLGGR